jgi:hypothetical protein
MLGFLAANFSQTAVYIITNKRKLNRFNTVYKNVLKTYFIGFPKALVLFELG